MVGQSVRVISLGLLALIDAGCGKHSVPKVAASERPMYLPVPQDPTCKADAKTAFDAFQQGDFAATTTTAADGYSRCRFGYGFLTLQAFVAAHGQDFDGAATLLLKEVGEPFPSSEAIHLLGALRAKVSPEVLTKVTQFGNTPEIPVVVPDIRGEYQWVALIVCGDPTAKPTQQALIPLPSGRSVDALSVTCAGQPETIRYFDYSADPNERLFMQQILEGR